MNRALWHVSPERSELRTVDPPTDAGLVPIRSLYSLISTGTERLVASGLAATAFDAVMAVPHMEGSFGLPVKYGYSIVGLDPRERLVHCMHPHQAIAYAGERELYPLPQNVPPRRMALLSNLETVINAIWDADLEIEAPVAVCGFGAIGSLLATALTLHNRIDAVVIEADPWRLDKARSLGFDAHDTAGFAGTFPTLFHTTGTARGLQRCLELAERDGSVIELSWYGSRDVRLHLGREFHYNRLRLISSQVSTIPPKMRSRYDFKKRKDLASDLLADDVFDSLITDEIAFGRSPEFFHKLRTGTQGDGLVWLIKY